MLQENLITNYKNDIKQFFLETDYEKTGIIEGDSKKWFNVKSLQYISGIAKLYSETKDSELLRLAKEMFFFILKKQHTDGYYDSEVYSENHEKMRANVIFINIELFNTFEIIENDLSTEEKQVFFESIKKSTKYICSYLNSSREINQVIAGLLYFQFCEKYDLSGKENVNLYSEVVKAMQNEQGYWAEKTESPSFDGLYGSLSLAYLARCCDLDNNLHPFLQRGLEFITQFLSDGDLDLSFSKRWIPNTPQGHRFLVYALSRCDFDYSEYMKKCIESNDFKCSYYVLRALENTTAKILLQNSKLNIHNLEIVKTEKNKLILSSLPSRVSGGEFTSLHNKDKGWIIQQPLIDKNAFPKNCSQVRVKINDDIYTSYLDNNALLSEGKVISNLKREDTFLLHTPFGFYESEKGTSDLMFVKNYTLSNNKLEVSCKLFFSNQLTKIEVIIPLLNGEVISQFETSTMLTESPYGKLSVNKLVIPFDNSKNVVAFNYEIHY